MDEAIVSDTPAPAAVPAGAADQPAPAKTKPAKTTRVARATKRPAEPAPTVLVEPAPAVQPKATSPKPIKAKAAKPKAAKPVPTKPAAAPARIKVATAPTKDTRTMTTPTTEITEKFQAAIKDASDKAKAAFEKSQSQLAEAGEFTKGNVEALIESSKILASGLQEMGKGYISESKTAIETLTAEIKDLTKVKTPAELMEKHTALLRKQFDAAVAASSKNSEAMLKLANEAFQPISTRVSLAVEKIKQAA